MSCIDRNAGPGHLLHLSIVMSYNPNSKHLELVHPHCAVFDAASGQVLLGLCAVRKESLSMKTIPVTWVVVASVALAQGGGPVRAQSTAPHLAAPEFPPGSPAVVATATVRPVEGALLPLGSVRVRGREYEQSYWAVHNDPENPHPPIVIALDGKWDWLQFWRAVPDERPAVVPEDDFSDSGSTLYVETDGQDLRILPDPAKFENPCFFRVRVSGAAQVRLTSCSIGTLIIAPAFLRQEPLDKHAPEVPAEQLLDSGQTLWPLGTVMVRGRERSFAYSPRRVTFRLGRAYHWFRCGLAIPDAEDTDRSTTLDISLDGGKDHQEFKCERLAEPVEVKVDVSDRMELTIDNTDDGDWGFGKSRAVLLDPRFLIGDEQPAAKPSQGEGAQKRNQVDGAELIWIPGATYTLGTPARDVRQVVLFARNWLKEATEEEFSNEVPQHSILLKGFWMYRHEVTNKQFAKFVEDTWYRPECGDRWRYAAEPADNSAQPDHPVVGITWHDAMAYAKWAGGRLPTEAEWEAAARGSDARAFPWGNDWDPSRCNYAGKSTAFPWSEKGTAADDRFIGTAPVGSFPSGASPFGALDMSGNVAEWCSTVLRPYPYAPDAAREDTRPGQLRVVRGGSWRDSPALLRCAHRRAFAEDGARGSQAYIGFRVVIPAERVSGGLGQAARP